MKPDCMRPWATAWATSGLQRRYSRSLNPYWRFCISDRALCIRARVLRTRNRGPYCNRGRTAPSASVSLNRAAILSRGRACRADQAQADDGYCTECLHVACSPRRELESTETVLVRRFTSRCNDPTCSALTPYQWCCPAGAAFLCAKREDSDENCQAVWTCAYRCAYAFDVGPRRAESPASRGAAAPRANGKNSKFHARAGRLCLPLDLFGNHDRDSLPVGHALFLHLLRRSAVVLLRCPTISPKCAAAPPRLRTDDERVRSGSRDRMFLPFAGGGGLERADFFQRIDIKNEVSGIGLQQPGIAPVRKRLIHF